LIGLQSAVHDFPNSIYSFFRTQSFFKKAKSPIPSTHAIFLAIVILVLLYALGLAPCVTVADAATVALAWDPSSDSVAGYKVHYGTSSKNYNYSADVGNYTSCSISGLEIGQTYYFVATAYDNQNNVSDFSEEISYTIPMVESEVEIEVTPTGSTAINPGDTVSYEIIVSNPSPDSKSVTAIVYTHLPNGTKIVLQGPISFNLAAGGSTGGTYTMRVSRSAPAGIYRVVGRVSTPGNNDFDEDEVIYELSL
jgi:uncharacterized repeat protein (TIGR01451 family)